MWLDITRNSSRAHIDAIVSRTRAKARDDEIIKTMDGEITKIICHHLKRANNHRRRR